jgi:hypothetical protein
VYHGDELLEGDRYRAEVADGGLGEARERPARGLEETLMIYAEASRPGWNGVRGGVMAGVRSEPLTQSLRAAPDLQVLGEPFGELHGREGFFLAALGVRGIRGERAALEQDEGGG